MNTRKYILFYLIILAFYFTSCGENYDVNTTANNINFNTSNGKMQLVIFGNNIVRVLVTPADTFSTRKSLII